jgi:uncharacterized membrane protein YphA (DoxX/SURF4 family)
VSLLKKLAALIGRIFISGIFIIEALDKFADWRLNEEMLRKAITAWQVFLSHSSSGGGVFFERILPFSTFLLALAAIVELIGGFFVLLGFKVRLGALLLILFLIPSTLLFHDFWHLDVTARSMQMILFLKNCAILGGLLNILAFGTGDKPQKAPSAEES